jgi:hypothetical protein
MKKAIKNSKDLIEKGKEFANIVARCSCEQNKIEDEDLIAKEYLNSQRLVKKLLAKKHIC